MLLIFNWLFGWCKNRIKMLDNEGNNLNPYKLHPWLLILNSEFKIFTIYLNNKQFIVTFTNSILLQIQSQVHHINLLKFALT